MADPAPDSGGLLGFFDRGYDPRAAYEGLLSEQPTKDAMMARALAGMASAFGQGAMPSPYKGGTPFLATLGQAAHAAYAGQDELMKARNLAAEQQLHYAQAGLAQSNIALNKILGPANQELIRRSMGGGTDAADKTGPASLLATPTGASIAGETYWTPEGLAALRPTEGKYDQIHYPSGDPSTASGAYGFLDRTWREQAPKANVDITKYPRAYMAPPAVQDAVAAITPIHHWTGVDANGKPFNAAAQKLATNPAFVTGPAASATPAAGASPASAPGAPPSLLAQVPHYTTFGEVPAAEAPPAVSAAAPRPAQPPGVSLNSRGQPISQDLSRDLPGQRIGSAAVAPNPNFAPTSPAIEAARAATAAQFGPGQVPDAAAAARYAPAPALPPGVPPVTSVPGGTNGIVPRPQSLLGPQPGAPPPAMAAADGPAGGLLGPQIPEAVAALARQAEPRLSQFAGPGVPTDAPPPLPPPPPSGGLITGGGARPPIAPVTGPMPGPPTSLLEPPAPPAAAAPPAAPPTGAPPPFVMPPLPTTMPALPTGGLTPPAPTAVQGMAMGIAGLSALTGRPAAPWVQDLAKMPAQMAMEQYKIYMTNQAAMMSKQYEKQLEIAGAQTISYLQDQGKLPGDLTRMTEQHNLLLRNSLAEKGMTLTVGPDGKPKYAISPEYLAAEAQREGQKAAAVAQAQQPTALEKIEREQRERGQQARLTARDEATNKPVIIPGVGLVVPGQLPGFNYQSVDSAIPNVAGPGGAPPAPGAQTSSNVLFRTQTEPQKAFLAANIAATEKQLATYHTEQAAAPEQIGTADMIEKLIPQTQFGWGEDTKVQAAMIMKRLGVSDESLKQFMGVNTAAAGDLTKLFLRFSTGAVREMGAREPGSVISLFMRNFPNLESDPDTARTMTNVLRMQAQYQQDRGAAAMRYANEQQRNAGTHGENYTGMNNFLESFDKTNPMKDYTRAAAAMSGYAGIGQQSRDVLKGLAWDGYTKPEDMQRVVALIPQGRTYLAPNGQLYPR